MSGIVLLVLIGLGVAWFWTRGRQKMKLPVTGKHWLWIVVIVVVALRSPTAPAATCHNTNNRRFSHIAPGYSRTAILNRGLKQDPPIDSRPCTRSRPSTIRTCEAVTPLGVALSAGRHGHWADGRITVLPLLSWYR